MTNRIRFSCPVCGYDELEDAAYDEHGCASFEICPSCGTEFGYDDNSKEHSRLRDQWKHQGMKWWSNSVSPPDGWDPVAQLRRARFDE
jgi:transposase-like protein